MLYKLSCQCIVLIIEQKYEGDTLVKVIARTLLRCSDPLEQEYHFGDPVIYDRNHNDMSKLPSNHDVWRKIAEGVLLTGDEQTTAYQQMNRQMLDGRRWKAFCQDLKLTLKHTSEE